MPQSLKLSAASMVYHSHQGCLSLYISFVGGTIATWLSLRRGPGQVLRRDNTRRREQGHGFNEALTSGFDLSF